MTKLSHIIRTMLIVTLGAAVPSTLVFGTDSPSFETDIVPLLKRHCHSCHGREVQESGLRLDVKPSAFAGGDGGPAIVPGKSGESELIRRIRSENPDEFMPPKGARLTSREIALLVRWIDSGASWPDHSQESIDPHDGRFNHWAWAPPQKVQAPAVQNHEWVHNDVDRFILAKIEKAGQHPAPQADKRTLLRRVTFDLTGLPPTPEETRAYLEDASADAWEEVVDRLLSSPAYGERWGRHWMDLVRYADTAGDNADYPVPEARRYRDYIIDSFNADKPYDQFVVEQLAGDILAKQAPTERYAEQIIATGYLAAPRRYATAPYELMHLTIEDAIETTGRTFLGLTMRCARCHDHKFDPMTMEDYYGIYGIFASTRFPYAGSEEFQSKKIPRKHFVSLLPDPVMDERMRQYQAEIEVLEPAVAEKEQDLEAAKDREDVQRRLKEELGILKRELLGRVKRGTPADLPVAYAVTEDKPVNQAIHKRGEPTNLGEVVARRAPRFFAGDAPLDIRKDGSGRLEFARWLARPENPLTARVMVNRIWQFHFGEGIVRTPSNFGVLGATPTHPELLDFLADYFVEQGWSIKAMHRLILTSATWKQTSLVSTSDPHLLNRHNRMRLDAESIRDAMLFVAGNLDRGRPAEHPFPEVSEWNWTQHNPFKAVYESKHRSVYLMRQRIQRHPFLSLFDAPDANVSTDVRTSATVPQQALFLMNNPFVREQAAAFSRRLASMAEEDAPRIGLAYEMAWCRQARPEEIERTIAYLAEYSTAAEKTGLSPAEARSEAWTSMGRILLTANEFFFLD
ncbi:MAG: PSD1 and planctomycete cytochrome C domain-containing protein [Planctomycetota bacterium]